LCVLLKISFDYYIIFYENVSVDCDFIIAALTSNHPRSIGTCN